MIPKSGLGKKWKVVQRALYSSLNRVQPAATVFFVLLLLTTLEWLSPDVAELVVDSAVDAAEEVQTWFLDRKASFSVLSTNSNGCPAHDQRQVCLISTEFQCMTYNSGGLGRAFYEHAFFLYTLGIPFVIATTAPLNRALKCSNPRFQQLLFSRLVQLPKVDHVKIPAGWYAAWQVYTFLTKCPSACSILHVPDYQGLGMFVGQAAKANLPSLQHTHVNVWAHGTAMMINIETRPEQWLETLLINIAERQGIEHASSLVALSCDHVGQLRNYYELPKHVSIIPNWRTSHAMNTNAASTDFNTIHELVFYGKISFRKGFSLFAEAVAELDSLGLKFVVYIVGPKVDATKTIAKAYDTLKKHSINVTTHSNLNTQQVLDFFNAHRSTALVVLPSLLEYQSYALFDLIATCVRFVASDIWAHRSVIRRDFDDVYFELSPIGLAVAIEQAVQKKGWTCVEANKMANSTELWIQWYRNVTNSQKLTSDYVPKKDCICVVVTACQEKTGIKQALSSVFQQQTHWLDVSAVVVASCGSFWTCSDIMAGVPYFHGKVSCTEVASGDVAVARNAGALKCSCDKITFQQDDGLIINNMLQKYVVAFQRNPHAKALVSWVKNNEGGQVFVGNAPEASVLSNYFGASNFAVRKSSFSLPIFEPFQWAGCDDWAFLSRQSVHRGLLLVPEFGLHTINSKDMEESEEVAHRCFARVAISMGAGLNATWLPPMLHYLKYTHNSMGKVQ